jgi:hypothetical protein
VQSGYTLSYIWMANEMGHFSLGFIITFFIVWIWKLISPSSSYTGIMLWIPFVHAGIWIVKEVIDFIMESIQAKKKKNFPVDLGDIFWDMMTAILNFSLGIAVAYVSLISFSWPLIIYGCSIPVTLLVTWYWLYRKICFQQAGLPFQFRLGDFSKRFSNDDSVNAAICKQILDVCTKNITGKHFLVFGKQGTQKTGLGVGMATEWTFNKGIARYTTYFKFLQLLPFPSEPTVQDGRKLWSWRYADMLVVDDVNPGIDAVSPASCANSRPDCFKNCLQNLGNSSENLKNLKDKTMVWIIGDVTNQNEWSNAFVSLGFPAQDIIIINIL